MIEVKAGYKQTEVGVIPEDWDARPIGDFFDFKNGLNKAKGFFGYGKPIVNYMDVYKSREMYSKNIHGRVDVNHQEIKSFNVKKGDVFFTRTSETVEEIGITSVLLDDLKNGVFSGFILRARSTNNDLEDFYKKYCFSPERVRKQIQEKSTYTTRALTNGRVLSKVKIFYPPKQEQSAIATILSDTDALIEHLEKLIAKKKAIKQGTMQQLLTGKKRLLGFSGEWKVKELGKIAEFYKGKGLPKSEMTKNGKYKCIHYGELFTTYHEEVKEIFSYTNKKDNFFLSHANDVLMPTSDVTPNGLATASCVKENEVILGGDVLVIRSFEGVLDGVFLSYGIRQNKKQIMQLVSGSTVYHLYGSDMKKYEFSFPPTIEEQTAIATILSDMDAEIEALEQKRDKYTMIKQGMMQQLLTGRIRIHGTN
jgi:type I restriction enzyme S subunit